VTDRVETPTEGEVLAYFDTLSNWGRWGPDDELGTLNLITAPVRLAALRSVEDGTSIGCARPIVAEDRASDVMHPPQKFMIRSGESPAATSAAEFIGLAFHGLTISHIDTLAHQFWNGVLYNGRPQRLIDSTQGATVLSVETMKDGLVTRGVLLDIPRLKGKPYLEAGEAIFPEDLEAAEQAQGVRVGEGDALLVRTGWYKRRNEVGPHPTFRHRPGLHASTLPWIRERGVAIAGADAAADVVPSGYPGIMMPLHSLGTVALGLCLMDNLQFEDVVPECERRGRWSFLFVVAPLRIRFGTGSPTTPLAIF
jgi:kynurenine formamidase